MDSGNSGSMQSSSGGDEEYDSRTEAISSFLNPSLHFGSSSNPNPPTFFDPSSHNLDSFSHSPNTNPLYNLDLDWSRNLRSDPNYTDYPSLTGSSSTPSLLGGVASQGPFPTLTIDGNTSRAPPPPQSSEQTNAVKNPKKRTRASRRAPTTVLTTDTANFRQMVQEFTGIPAAPFSSTSSSPYSRRLDLFGAGSAAMRSGHLDTLGPLYPLRPQVQKVQLTPYVPSSSSSSSPSFMVDAITSNNNTIVGTSHNYQPPSDLGLSKHPQNMENPILTFSLLGSSRIPSMAEMGMNANLTRWSDGGGRENLGSFGGNNGNSLYKFDTSSASTSDFHHEKGLENVSSRGEGTVDSWICPSD